MRLIFILVGSVFFLASISKAQIYYGSASRAVGETGRGAIRPGDQVFLNAAGLVHIGGRYLTASTSASETAIGLSDNTPDSSLPAAVGYWKTAQIIDGLEIRKEDFRVGLAEFVVPNLAFGVVAHQFSVLQQDRADRAVNGEAGVVWTPRDNLGVVLVAYDFLSSAKRYDDNSLFFQPRTGIGFNYLFRKQTMFRVDLLSGAFNNFGKSKISIGYEGYWNRWTAFRLGYSDDQAIKSRNASVGLGLDLPRFQIQYAYQGDVDISGNYRHSVDLGIPF